MSKRTLGEELDELIKRYKPPTTFNLSDVVARIAEEWPGIVLGVPSDHKSKSGATVASAPVELKQLDRALALSNEGEFKKAIIELVEYLKANHK